MAIFWRYESSLGIDAERLVVEEYNREVLLPGEPRVYVDGRGPMPIRIDRYELELSRSREPVCKKPSSTAVYSASALAEVLVIRYLAWVDEVTAARNREQAR